MSIALCSLLADGAGLLSRFHLPANREYIQHSFSLVSRYYFVFVFLTYSGDSWVHHALGSFAQTVGDECFTRHESQNTLMARDINRTLISYCSSERKIDSSTKGSSIMCYILV